LKFETYCTLHIPWMIKNCSFLYNLKMTSFGLKP
jgi:hypothetical protein